jgi:nucleoid-associated protein YgaU
VNTPLAAALNRTADRPAAAAPPGEGDAQASDWGMAPEKSGMSRENKFILFVLLVLVAVFSFVVFRNFQKKGGKEEMAKTAAENGDAAKKEGENGKDTAEDKKHSENETETGSETAGKSHKHKHNSAELADAPAQEEPAQLSTDMFEAEGEKPEKLTAQRASKHRTHGNAAAEQAESNEVLLNSETAAEAAEPAHRHGRRRDEFGSEVPQKNAVSEPDETELAMETRPRHQHPQTQPEQAGPGIDRGRAHQQHARGQSEEVEGSAETTEVLQESTPAEMPKDAGPSFANAGAFDANVEQTAGTEYKGGPRRIGKKANADLADSEELAQAGSPTMPDEVGGGTLPHRAHSHGTGNRVSGPPAARAQHAAGLPPTAQNEDKFGGLQPQDVTRRPAAPRGNFDPQADPLVSNTGEYVIRPNDNYWRISRKVYGTARYFDALRKHNELTLPDAKNLKVGTRIATPSMELLEQQYKDILPVIAAPKPAGAMYHSPNAPKAPGFFLEPGNQPAYRVGPTDTLSGISQKTLNRSSRWDEIYELNRDRLAGHDQLTVGTILRLPADASQPRLVASPTAKY